MAARTPTLTAQHTATDPRDLGSDAQSAFAGCEPVVITKPSLWPGDASAPTSARLLWDEDRLYILYSVEGSFAPPVRAEQCNKEVLSALLSDYGATPQDAWADQSIILLGA